MHAGRHAQANWQWEATWAGAHTCGLPGRAAAARAAHLEGPGGGGSAEQAGGQQPHQAVVLHVCGQRGAAQHEVRALPGPEQQGDGQACSREWGAGGARAKARGMGAEAGGGGQQGGAGLGAGE